MVTILSSTQPAVEDVDDDKNKKDDDEYADLDEFRPPTDEEMADIFKKLEGQDINEIYEQQEERKKKGQLTTKQNKQKTIGRLKEEHALLQCVAYDSQRRNEKQKRKLSPK